MILFAIGWVTGILTAFVLSLCVAMGAIRYIRRVDSHTWNPVQSESQGNDLGNPMRKVYYHGSENPPDGK